MTTDVGIRLSVSPEAELKLDELSALLKKMPELVADKFLSDLLALCERGSLYFTVIKRFPASGTVNGAIGIDVLGIDELIAAARSAVESNFAVHERPLSC